MAQIAYVDWDGLVYYDGKIKDYISNNLEDTLKDGGQVLYTQLPSPTRNTVNYVYTVTENFTRTQELFGVNGGTYNAGTAVKVTEVTPGQYLYTILNETRNPSDVETFDDIYAQIKELKEEIDSINPESSDYYTKVQIDELFAETNDELRRQDARLDEVAKNQYNDHLKLDQKADKSYIDKVLKDFSTDNYYTKEEADKKFATFDDIASNVLFPDKIYEVTKPVGGFVKGAKINNITVSQMFTDLLGLEEYIEPIIPEHELPLGASELSKALFQSRRKLYTLDNSGELTEAPIIPEYYRITTNIEDPENDTSNYLYFILDSSNMVAEEGYQVFTPYNESDYWLTIFLPNEINQFDIKVYSTTKEWVTPNWTFQSIEHSNTPSGYTAYMADENYQVAPGVSVRIIFNREGEINNGR